MTTMTTAELLTALHSEPPGARFRSNTILATAYNAILAPGSPIVTTWLHFDNDPYPINFPLNSIVWGASWDRLET